MTNENVTVSSKLEFPLRYFLSQEPSLQEVLFWKNPGENISIVLQLLSQYLPILIKDYDKISDKDYLLMLRVLKTLRIHKYHQVYEQVLQLYLSLQSTDDEVIRNEVDLYLNELAAPEHYKTLKTAYQNMSQEERDEDLLLLPLLFKVGGQDRELYTWALDALYEGNYFVIAQIIPLSNDSQFLDEVKDHLKYIAPFVKYLPFDRFKNPYVDEWIEIGSAYWEKKCPESFAQLKLARPTHAENESLDEQSTFFIQMTEWDHPLATEMREEKRSGMKEIDYSKLYQQEVQAREEFLNQEFCNQLPLDYTDWLEDPLTVQAQIDDFADIARALNVGRHTSSSSARSNFAQKLAPIKIGRNDPCPCESGKKYKRCCGL